MFTDIPWAWRCRGSRGVQGGLPGEGGAWAKIWRMRRKAERQRQRERERGVETEIEREKNRVGGREFERR